MVIATNESSYGVSAASDQLIALAKVNAAAVGLDTALAAITGKSTFILGDGTVGPTTNQLEEVVLYGSLQFRVGPQTIWVRFGDWLAMVAMVVALAVVALPGERGVTPIAGSRKES